MRGFITRITPHWFHVLYYRYVLRLPNAGKPGYGPYVTVTYYAPVVSRHGIRNFCEKHHFRISEERGSGSYLGQGLVAVLSRTLARVIAWLSLGRLKDNHADLMYILKKDLNAFRYQIDAVGMAVGRFQGPQDWDFVYAVEFPPLRATSGEHREGCCRREESHPKFADHQPIGK